MIETGLMLILILLGICDAYHQKLPAVLLVVFTLLALCALWQKPVWSQVSGLLFGLIMLGLGLLLCKKGKMGGGDVWVLSVLALIWPAELFWHSLCNGLLLLGLTAGLMWVLTGDEKEKVPLVPFLLLGYWAAG